jgi:hypothetical protein
VILIASPDAQPILGGRGDQSDSRARDELLGLDLHELGQWNLGSQVEVDIPCRGNGTLADAFAELVVGIRLWRRCRTCIVQPRRNEPIDHPLLAHEVIDLSRRTAERGRALGIRIHGGCVAFEAARQPQPWCAVRGPIGPVERLAGFITHRIEEPGPAHELASAVLVLVPGQLESRTAALVHELADDEVVTTCHEPDDQQPPHVTTITRSQSPTIECSGHDAHPARRLDRARRNAVGLPSRRVLPISRVDAVLAVVRLN